MRRPFLVLASQLEVPKHYDHPLSWERDLDCSVTVLDEVACHFAPARAAYRILAAHLVREEHWLLKNALVQLKARWHEGCNACLESVATLTTEIEAEDLARIIWTAHVLDIDIESALKDGFVVRTTSSRVNSILSTRLVCSARDLSQHLVSDGYNEGFADMVAALICSSASVNDVVDCEDIVDRITTPLQLNSILLRSTHHDFAVYVTHLHDQGGQLLSSPQKILQLGVRDRAVVPLRAESFQMNGMWQYGNFAKFVYETAMNNLKGVVNAVYGHVTKEESIVTMARSGISASTTSANSCGHAFYLFRLTTFCEWEKVNALDGTAVQQQEFQSFMYALTRPIARGYICPAVLLFGLNEDTAFPGGLMDANVDNLDPPICTTAAACCPSLGYVRCENVVPRNPLDVRQERLNALRLVSGAYVPPGRPMISFVSEIPMTWKKAIDFITSNSEMTNTEARAKTDAPWRQSNAFNVDATGVVQKISGFDTCRPADTEQYLIHTTAPHLTHHPREVLLFSDAQIDALLQHASYRAVAFIAFPELETCTLTIPTDSPPFYYNVQAKQCHPYYSTRRSCGCLSK